MKLSRMLDSVVASVRCDGLALEPSADLPVWLVNELLACRVLPAVWLQRGARTPIDLNSDVPAAVFQSDLILLEVTDGWRGDRDRSA